MRALGNAEAQNRDSDIHIITVYGEGAELAKAWSDHIKTHARSATVKTPIFRAENAAFSTTLARAQRTEDNEMKAG